MIEPMTFCKRPDGSITLVGDHWPQHVMFSRELVDRGVCMTFEENVIEVSVANGFAFYRVIAIHPGTGVIEPMREKLEAVLESNELGIGNP